jgi:hypothetical protein
VGDGGGEREKEMARAIEDRSSFAGECWTSLTGPNAGLFESAGLSCWLMCMCMCMCMWVWVWMGGRAWERESQGNLPDLEAGFSRKLKRLIVHCGAHHNRQLQALLMEVNM